METKENLNRIIDYIADNFNNSVLTIRVAENDLGIPEKEISSLLYTYLNTTFKEYLMQTRINEMRRLLVQTNLPIREIYPRIGLPDPLQRKVA